MQLPPPRRILWVVAVAVLLLSLALAQGGHRKISVTVLDPRFRLITTSISHGTTHKLYLDSWPKGRLMELVAATGVKAGCNPMSVKTTNSSYALVARYIGDLESNKTYEQEVWAEIVDGSGTSNSSAPAQGYRKIAAPYECGMIWLLDSPLTNDITIRLTAGRGGLALAEIQVGAR